MTKTEADAGHPLSIYVGVGVGAYEHHDKYPILEKAVAEVEDVSRILAEYGYDVHVFKNPDRSDVADRLDDLLQQDVLRNGGSLVILWSGHGEPAEKGGLNLIARNTKPGSAALLTPEYLADLAARTGANQILLILDTCFSGGGVMPATVVADAVLRELPPDAKRVWIGVVASTMDFERARDGAFGARLIKLLRSGPDDSELRKRWSSHSVGVRGDDLIDALVKEWDIPEQLPKGAAVGNAWIMLPNPIYRSVSPEYMDAHLRDAARGGEPGEDGFFFTGRIGQLDRIVAWMQEGKPGALVVTGPPGIGKSAILGRIVSLSNRKERSQLLAQGPLEHADPGEGSVSAHVHALRYTAERLVAAIDEQLILDGILPTQAGGPRNRGELQGAIQQSGRCPVIVVDGLDESGSESWRIAEDVLRTLSEVSLVLVGTRDLPPADGPLSLIKALGAKEVIDLCEAAIQPQAEADMRRYVEKRLSTVAAPAMDNSKVAGIVMKLSRERHAGAFLLARFVTTRVRSAPVDTSLPNWQDTLLRSIEESIENHVAGVPPLHRGGLAIPQAARELLEALAWAKGPGLPDDIWPIVATALSPTGTTYERSDVYWLLAQVGRYIIEDGQGGRAVYRLVHQRLSEHFQTTSGTSPDTAASGDPAVKVARALVGYYQDLLTAGQLPQTSGYLWRYVWRHCADAGEPGIDALRLLFERDKKAFAAQLARALSELSKSTAGLGRWQEASAAARETTKLYRELVESDVTLRADFAEALVALGRIQILVGQQQESVDAAREAVNLFKTMDTANPAVGLPFATALSTLSLGYGLTGKLREAVQPASDAVSLLRQLSSDNPAFGPDLANALTVLGLGYSQTGQPKEAVDVAREAVNLFRTMDTSNPSVGLTFAWALTVLGLGYSQTGQPKEAVDVAREAVNLFRTLDTSNPAVALLLASALSVLGLSYSQTGQSKEAVGVAREAVDFFRTLDTSTPAVGPPFAWALTVLGLGYSQMGKPKEAVEAAGEAVHLFRTLDTSNPAVGLPFAWALTVLGLSCTQTGQPKEGLSAAQESVELFRSMDTSNPAMGLPFASALSVLGLSYSQTGKPKEAVEAAREAVHLFRTLDTSNPAVGLPCAWALTVLGLSYTQTGQPKEGLTAAQEAVELFRSMDTSNPAVALPFASALSILGQGYTQTDQPKEAVDAAREAVDLYRDMDAYNPAVALPFASALSILGQGYMQTGHPKEAVEAAGEAVGLFRTLDASNPAVALSFAWALTVLGQGYSQTGKPQEAMESAKEAVQIAQDPSGSNPASLPLLAGALGSFGDYCRMAGQGGEIDAQWEAAVDLRERPGDKAFLLLRRAEGREPGDALAVGELIRAKSYLVDTDRERIADLHRVCRFRRSADPVAFDAAWRRQSGENPPQWLTFDESLASLLVQWIDTVPLESARDFLREHIGGLSAESSSVALDEIALMLDDPSVIEPFRELLGRVFAVGVDEAYRPMFALRLLSIWMSADWATTRAMLLEHRLELLGNDVEESLRALLAGNPEDPQLIVRKALLDLARMDREDLAFRAMEDPTRAPALLLDLARAGDGVTLDATAAILFFVHQTDAERALACFYGAIALVLKARQKEAFDAVVKARRLDPTQVPAWLALLVELASKHQELTALAQAFVMPLPMEETGKET